MYGNYVNMFDLNSQYVPLSMLLFYAGQCFCTNIYNQKKLLSPQQVVFCKLTDYKL